MKLFFLDAADLSPTDVRLVREYFPERFAQAERMVNRQDGRSVLAAGVLLARILGVEDERQLCKTPEGRPYLRGGPAFSLSHSGGRCVLAAGGRKLGVDIEKLDESNLLAARVALTQEELAWIEPSPLERFHILWTRKESLYKALGGFSDPKEIPALDGMQPEGLHIRSRILNGFALSLCSDVDPGEPEPVHLNHI